MMKWVQQSKLLILICLLAVTGIVSRDIAQRKSKTLASQPSELRIEQVREIATEITVKISNQELLGSGILMQKKGNRYIVITNQHVLRAGEKPYQIETFDGKIHAATVIPTRASSRYDIAVLEFVARQDNYRIATMGNSSELQVGEPVFAVGFPYQYQETDSSSATPKELKELSDDSPTGIKFTKGRVSVILDQALEEGYQIGYTNEVQKGMSGGALLTIQGLLVGVNGKHAYPLWEAPDYYEDQSQPCEPLQELIIRSSLAIPLKKVTNATPEVAWQALPNSSIFTTDKTWSSVTIDETETNPEELIATMQAEAASSKLCQ
ncbi:trypsin-like serine protease with C-terminal PDZ domain [Xenococcus sp. PCC 7305]|uniref:S1 family peptidase n=1 Tax=Xenococcus sp. PCC 7305 TaxID=102125 RepID=UPI0002ABDA6E|nr:serine protease [Xenococcus sp. PCC 7305]ELS01827.1 trypsin-like serine protease with C-terminal PDZ domain [Xenococcus sp. PCC 7305]